MVRFATSRHRELERVGFKLVDSRDVPEADYLRNIVIPPGMTVSQRADLEGQGVVFPVVTDEYRATVALYMKSRSLEVW